MMWRASIAFATLSEHAITGETYVLFIQGFNPLKTKLSLRCCRPVLFTPILAILLGVGAGWLTGYLDYVLFPVLFIF
jgi:hypothetical protein